MMIPISDAVKNRVAIVGVRLWLVWGVLTLSLGAFYVATQQIPVGDPSQSVSVDGAMLAPIAYVIAAGALVGSLAFMRWCWSAAQIKAALNRAPAKVPQLPSLYEGLSPHEATAMSAFVRMIPLCIVPFVLSEVASIAGFLLAVLSGTPNAIVPFLCGSFIVNALNRPDPLRRYLLILEIAKTTPFLK